MRRRARVFAALTAPVVPVYAALAASFGRARPPRNEPLAFDAPAVVVAPHPDDEVLGCGGLVTLHARRARVTVVVCTDGSASRAVSGDASARGAVRRAECEAAQRLLGTELVWLGVSETLDPDVDDLAERLAPLLAGARVVYAPSRVDFHPGHRAVAEAVARVLSDETEVRVYASSVPLGRLANRVADVGEVEADVLSATAAYATQQRTLWCAARQRLYVAAFHGVGRLAEAVWTMPAPAYRALHVGPHAAWPDAFRGLRPHPLTDPLAWWVGRAERARLA